MKSQTLHCSQCNALVTVSDELTFPHRLRCWQCEEVFVHPPSATLETGQTAIVDTKPSASENTAAPKQSNSKVAMFALAAMAGVACVALLFALRTIDFRRNVTLTNRGALADYAPAKLPALDYAPHDNDIVIGIHVGRMRNTNAGRQLITDDTQGVGWMLHQFEQAAGITPKGVDHVVACIDLSDLSHVSMIVRTRSQYNPKAVGQDTRTQTTTFRGKPAYRLKLKKIGSGWLWCVDEKTLVFLWQIGFSELADLSRFPTEPQPDLSPLSPQLRKLLEKRIDKRARLWIAADLGNEKWRLPFPFEKVDPIPIRYLAVSAMFGETTTLLGSLQGKTTNDTIDISNMLKARLGEKLKIVPPPANIENAEQNWLQWQFRGNANRIWPMLQKIFDVVGSRKR